jgi:hypothetical protein
MPERAWGWTRRIHFGAGRTVSLDWGQELWKWDVCLYESADGIAAALRRSGLPFDDGMILFDATRSLLLDVVDAAGGVERSHTRLHQAMAHVQETWDRWQSQWQSTIGGRPESGELRDGMGMTDSSVEDAWYTVEELLVWARTLDDRLRRAAKKKGYPDQGLIPALAEGPRRDAVIRARSRLLSAGVTEARYLSGLNLHMQSIQAGSKHGRLRSGRIVLPFPDHVTAPVNHRWDLTYKSDRDAVSFADGLMAAVECFLDDLISAFERHIPDRFKTA